MKNQEKIRIFSQKQEKQDILKKSGKNQESNTAARPVDLNPIVMCTSKSATQLTRDLFRSNRL
jgi:hypothetical protein